MPNLLPWPVGGSTSRFLASFSAMSPFLPHRSPCLSLNASNVLLDRDLCLCCSTEILSFQIQYIQFLTSFRSLLMYHFPERSSLTTPSKTKLLNHLISSFACLFVAMAASGHIIYLSCLPQENGNPMEEGILSLQFSSVYLGPWMAPGPLCLRMGEICQEVSTVELVWLQSGKDLVHPLPYFTPSLSRVSRDHLHNKSHITESLLGSASGILTLIHLY